MTSGGEAATTSALGNVPSMRLREVIVFLMVGGTSTALFAAFGVLFTRASVRPSLAMLLALAILIPPSYLGQRSLTFRSDRPHHSAFPRYVGTQAVGNVLGLIVAEAFPAIMRNHPQVAFLLLAIGVASTNYLLLRLWAFQET